MTSSPSGPAASCWLGLLQRPTRDLDVVALIESEQYVKVKALPGPLAQAVREVGDTLGLGPNWLNVGRSDLLDFGLPEGFALRTKVRRYGSLTLRIAGREDQVALKLYAATDQGPQSKHLQDLRALAPKPEEPLRGARWAITDDPSQPFRSELVAVLEALGMPDADQLL